MRVELLRGDITELAADAIVNAANEQLVLGGGVAGAIRAKGGAAIQKECDRLAPVATGSAVATTAGNLPHRYVIHAVAPHISLVDWEARLERTVHAVLKLADSLQLAHVGLPALGTGTFGLPIGRAARIMLTAVYSAPPVQHVQQITFCLFDDNALRTFDQAHQALLARARQREHQARQAQERPGQNPDYLPQDRQPLDTQDWDPQDRQPQERHPQDRQPHERHSQDRQPQDRQPRQYQDRQGRDRQPQDRQPQDRQGRDRQPQDRQPQDRQPQQQRDQRHGSRPQRHRHGRDAPAPAAAAAGGPADNGLDEGRDEGLNGGFDDTPFDAPPEGGSSD